MRDWEGISENKIAINLVLLPFIRFISTSGADYSCDPRQLDTCPYDCLFCGSWSTSQNRFLSNPTSSRFYSV